MTEVDCFGGFIGFPVYGWRLGHILEARLVGTAGVSLSVSGLFACHSEKGHATMRHPDLSILRGAWHVRWSFDALLRRSQEI